MGEELASVDGPPELEALPRYLLQSADLEASWRQARQAAAEGRSVLWVSNTVQRACDLARRARSERVAAFAYHSRFRYEDRVRRHRAVVDGFTRPAGAAGLVALTTQVCEVSLDLSADLLVTELAPVPSLIQRLGRLNRRATPADPRSPGPALVIEPPGPEPYEPEDLAQAKDWIARLGPGPLSQRQLADMFDEIADAETSQPLAIAAAWLDGGPFSLQAPLREAGTTIPVVRGEDAPRLAGRAGAGRAREVVRLTIPMPLGPVAREIRTWRREGAALVAPVGRLLYEEDIGGRWP
jgi:CRISPR-associated endonuclease/helicase Cas3